MSTGRTRTGTDTLWPGRHATWNCSNASVYGSGSGHQPLRDDARGFSRPSVCERVCVCRCVWVPCLCCVCFMLNNCVHILFVGFFFVSLLCLTHYDDGRGVGGTGGDSCIRRANSVTECACASKSNLHPSVSQTTTN